MKTARAWQAWGLAVAILVVPAAIADCREAGINCIADGSCLLVYLGFDNNWQPA